MCGFSGYLNFSSNISEIEQKKIINSSKLLEHRGPDKTNIIIHKHLCAVFHRLSIIDPSEKSDQPFQKDKNLILFFNGEIYNYKDLKNEFSESINLITQSDTEIIYELYKLKGEDFINHLKGMYSIALIDLKNKKGFFVRDQEGIKPLYFAKYKNGLLFASELKFFKNFDFLDINNLQIFCYLYMGFTIDPETYLKGVYSLNKDKKLIFEKDNNKDIKFKNKDIKNKPNFRSKEDLTNTISKNINSHIIADVEGAIHLSGGYDSYFILKTLLNNNDNHNLKSIINIDFFGTNKFDIINKENLNNILKNHNFTSYFHKYDPKQFFDDVETFLNNMDQPTIDGLNTFAVSKITKLLGFKYALNGLGADELFDGYNLTKKYKYLKILSKFNNKIPHKIQIFLYRNFLRSNPKFLSNIGNDILDDYLTLRSLRTELELNEFYNLKEIHLLKCQLKDLIIDNYDFNQSNKKNNLLLIDKEIYMCNQLLKNTDWISMLNSVEIRVPYIHDHFHIDVLGSPILFSKYETIGIDYEKFYKKNYKKIGFSFPIQNYLAKVGFTKLNKNPLKDWSLEVLDKSFGIGI